MILFQHILAHKIRQAQLFGAYAHKFYARIAHQCGDQAVYGAAKFQVAAKADGQMIQAALFAGNGEQVGEGLGGVLMAAVTCIDDGHRRKLAGDHGRTLFMMAHGNNGGIAAHHPHRIGHGFALGGAGVAGAGKADHRAAQIEHGAFKA